MLRSAPNALLAAVVLVMPLAAQRGGGLPILEPTVSPAARSRSLHSANGQHAHGNGRAVYLGTPFWADDFDSSYAEGPPVVVVQAAPAQKSVEREEPKAEAPLLIELQGDRYVRRTDRAEGANPPASARDHGADTESAAGTVARGGSTQPHVELPPTLFVFRDGHREESSDYSIVTGVIYARSQYWTSGSWTKQIPLSQLDLPATFKANQERGFAFRLPNAPNEVVTRP
ncbi:MAG TPA: hypothetical protein VNY29_12975 [Terriglobales bacterium]|jgi:hypothetical protein|nr:hypothetical protein [Terriglobales bacterium]